MPPRTLAHYEILAPLGAGGMGEVYRARDTRLDREVALKILPPDLAGDPQRRSRFESEAKAVAALNHPNIVTVFSIEEAGGQQFLTMELVPGEPLGEVTPAEGMEPARVLHLALQLTDALAAVHEKGITHRDLKPSNIMVDPRGRVKVLDFGVAKVELRPGDVEEPDSAPTLTAPGVLLGTVAYMSPEQIEGKPADARSDIFSLGIILYRLLTGVHPFTGASQAAIMSAILRDEPAPITRVRPGLPRAFETICARCLAKDPDDRFASMTELQDELRALADPADSSRIGTPGAGWDSSDSGLRAVGSAPAPAAGRSRRPLGIGVAVVAVAALAMALWLSNRSARDQAWIHETAIPGIEAALDTLGYAAAWDLAQEIEEIDPGNPALAGMLDSFSREIPIVTEPEGATVYRRFLESEPDAWALLGTTPLTVRVPSGYQRFRFEKEGYVPSEIASHWYYLQDQKTLLAPAGEFPEDMIYVPGGEVVLNIPGLDHLDKIELGSYLISRHEVTNAEYAAFVNAGGYADPAHWTEPFLLDGEEIPFPRAMERFVDGTGQPGPATWEAGDFREGEGDHPVTGISWYEAAAYCAFAGRSLPTVYHWNRAAETRISNIVVPGSNFGGRGTLPVGESPGLTAFGVRDMAGNAREWCTNATDQGERVILGGGWNDQPYMFNDFFAQDPWDRSATNGLRTAIYLGEEVGAADAVIVSPHRDFRAEEPVSDEVFEVFLGLYDYDKGPLDAEVLLVDDSHEDYRTEYVEFAAAYGGERMQAYVYIPKHGEGPFPTLVYFPGSDAIHARDSGHLLRARDGFLMKQGYALIHPVYKSTYERGDELESDYADESQFYADHVIMWGKDMSRSIDYLESRPEFDTDRLAYYGVSWGGGMGGIMLAVEPRFRTGILYVAGFMLQKTQPVADAINYVPRITIPVLMLNGKYDHFFPVESAQLPMYDLLGTRPEHKKHYLYETGHFVPRKELMREILAWLGVYLADGGA